MSEAKSRVRLCGVDDIETGSMLQVSPPGLPALAVYRIADGEFYCTQDLCTHERAYLSDGVVVDCVVECPFHQGRFHIPTGRPVAPPCTQPIRVWTACLVDGMVCIDPAEKF